MLWLGAGCLEGRTNEAERPDTPGERVRVQSPHSTDAARSAEGRRSKARLREGGQEGGCEKIKHKHRKVPQCCRLQLNRDQRLGIGPGLKLVFGRNAWCRRWITASKEVDGTV